MSSAVGFITLFGVSVMNGVLIVGYMRRARASAERDAARRVLRAVAERLRPVLMTALPASIGLLPAALSHSIGSDTQRPFAIVIVGGLLPATLLTMFLLPTTYELAERWFGGWLAQAPPRDAGGAMTPAVDVDAASCCVAALGRGRGRGAAAAAQRLTSEQAVAVALQRNRDAIAARLEIEASELDVVAARIYPNPLAAATRSATWCWGGEPAGRGAAAAGLLPASGCRPSASARSRRLDEAQRAHPGGGAGGRAAAAADRGRAARGRLRASAPASPTWCASRRSGSWRATSPTATRRRCKSGAGAVQGGRHLGGGPAQDRARGAALPERRHRRRDAAGRGARQAGGAARRSRRRELPAGELAAAGADAAGVRASTWRR